LNTYFAIPYRDTSHPAISIWELREAKRKIELDGKDIDERALFEAYDRMRAIELQAQAKTLTARRSEQRRRNNSKAFSMHGSNVTDSSLSSNQKSDSTPTILPFDDMDDLA
jgi:putative transposase